MNLLIGATQTGGSSVTYSPAGSQPGKSAFVTPDHTRLTPHTVEFTASGGTPSGSDPGVARTGMKITFADRQVTEGCCTVQTGSVIVDLGVRWSLNQPDTLVDDVIDSLRGLVYTTEFENAVKKGVLPSA